MQSNDFVKIFQEVFNPERKRRIKPEDVEAALIANGFLEEKCYVMDLIQTLRMDKDGFNPDDLKTIFDAKFLNLLDQANIKTLFSYYDTNSDGKITIDDLMNVSEDLGFSLDPTQALIMIRSLAEGDGVTLKQFTSLLLNS